MRKLYINLCPLCRLDCKRDDALVKIDGEWTHEDCANGELRERKVCKWPGCEELEDAWGEGHCDYHEYKWQDLRHDLGI